MKDNSIMTKPAKPLEPVRVGICTDLDPSDPYTAVTLEVQGVRESLTPCEAREVARLLGDYAKMVDAWDADPLQ